MLSIDRDHELTISSPTSWPRCAHSMVSAPVLRTAVTLLVHVVKGASWQQCIIMGTQCMVTAVAGAHAHNSGGTCTSMCPTGTWVFLGKPLVRGFWFLGGFFPFFWVFRGGTRAHARGHLGTMCPYWGTWGVPPLCWGFLGKPRHVPALCRGHVPGGKSQKLKRGCAPVCMPHAHYVCMCPC